MLGQLLYVWGLALGLCLMAGIVYAALRLLVWPLLAWTRWRLRSRLLARDAQLQNHLYLQGDARGVHGWFPPAC